MKRSGASLALIAALFLAGCAPESSTADPSQTAPGSPSASESPSRPASTEPEPSEAATPSTDSVEGVAQLVGLTGFAISNEESPYIERWGKGTLDGSDVRVYEFADDEQFATYIDSVAAFGITADDFVRIDNFAVAPTDSSQLAQIRESVLMATGEP